MFSSKFLKFTSKGRIFYDNCKILSFIIQWSFLRNSKSFLIIFKSYVRNWKNSLKLKMFLFNIRRIFSKTRKDYKLFLLLCFFNFFLWKLLALKIFYWNTANSLRISRKKIHWNYFKRNNLNFKQSRYMLITKKILKYGIFEVSKKALRNSSQKWRIFLSNLENFSPKLENVLQELESFLKHFELLHVDLKNFQQNFEIRNIVS